MLRPYTVILLTCVLAACQPSKDGSEISKAETPTTLKDKVETVQPIAGEIRLVLVEPVSEPLACIVPIRVENGLSTEVSVTMIGFGVTGPGGSTTGNMFAPNIAPGKTYESRVILEGRSCNAYDSLNVSNINCSSGGESCVQNLSFKDGTALKFAETPQP